MHQRGGGQIRLARGGQEPDLQDLPLVVHPDEPRLPQCLEDQEQAGICKGFVPYRVKKLLDGAAIPFLPRQEPVNPSRLIPGRHRQRGGQFSTESRFRLPQGGEQVVLPGRGITDVFDKGRDADIPLVLVAVQGYRQIDLIPR